MAMAKRDEKKHIKAVESGHKLHSSFKDPPKNDT
jgi:hypothetical protein